MKSAGYVPTLAGTIRADANVNLFQSEVLHSPPLSLLPKNPLHAPSHNPTLQSPTDLTSSFATSPNSDSPDRPGQASEYSSATPYIAHHLLPSPSASRPLKHPDARFMDSEAFTDKFANHLSGTMEKVNRRTVKRWADRGQGASELGALLNGFSLETKGSLQRAVEKFGQAVDAEQLTTALLVSRVIPPIRHGIADILSACSCSNGNEA